MSVDERKGMSDAYWRAREAADAERAGTPDAGADDSGGMTLPEMDFSGGNDGPPPTPAPEPDSEGWSPYKPAVQTSAPAAAPGGDLRSQRLAALREAAKLAGSPVDTGIGDKDIAAAQGRDREQRGRDAFTEAIQSFLMRKPVHTPRDYTEASDLMQRKQLGEASALKQRGQQLTVQEQIAKALTEKPDPGTTMTAYQTAELDRQKKADSQKSTDRQTALADRKRTMLSLYPAHKAEIDALTDLGDAQTLQTALEGRMGREDTQAHQDTAAATASQRELNKQISFEEWKSKHRPPTAEQAAQLEGIEKSDAAIDTFEKSIGSTSSIAGKAGAAFPKVGGAVGAPGSDFQAVREGTAIALARGLEGGMARPGNVEIIMRMLPDASDHDDVKAQKMAHVREFIANNREAFKRAIEQTGTQVHPSTAPPRQPIAPPAPERPHGIPAEAKFVGGKWMWRDASGIQVRDEEGH